MMDLSPEGNIRQSTEHPGVYDGHKQKSIHVAVPESAFKFLRGHRYHSKYPIPIHLAVRERRDLPS